MDKSYLTKDKIIGKHVINSEGMIVGSVKDLSFNIVGGGISLTVTTNEGSEINVSSENIRSVGDVILLREPIETPEKPDEPKTVPKEPASKSPGLCSGCGFQNEPDNNFCIKCGAKL